MRFPRCGHKANLPVLLLGYCPDCTSPCFNMELVADASWALALKITPFDHWNMQKRMLKYLPSSFKLVAQLGWEGRMDWWCFSWEPCRPHEDLSVSICFKDVSICFEEILHVVFNGCAPACSSQVIIERKFLAIHRIVMHWTGRLRTLAGNALMKAPNLRRILDVFVYLASI